MLNVIARRSLVLAAAGAVALASDLPRVLADAPAVARTFADKPDKGDAKDDAAAVKLLATTIDRIVSANGIGDLGEVVAGNDRERVDPGLKGKHEKFDKMVADFRDAWQKKYDDNFSMATHSGILTADRIEEVDRYGKHYAIAYFKEMEGKPAFEVHLVKDKGGDYRVALPNSIDGEGLVQRFTGNLQYLFEKKADWPSSQSVAYQMASNRLLYALRYGESNKEEAKPKK